MNRTLVVTGASGFVGRALTEVASEAGWTVRRLSRQDLSNSFETQALRHGTAESEADSVTLDTVFAATDSFPPVVIHLAARAHVLREHAADPLTLFRRANVNFSVSVARAAFSRGVKRFIFVSSIGAVGEQSKPGNPLSECTPCKPRSDYGISKLEAEAALKTVAMEYGAELVIVRPPLVYGPGAPGNLARMARWLSYGVPLPLKNVRNQRSLIHVRNLCNALLCCAVHERAPGHTYHVRDLQDYSTPEILQLSTQALGTGARLFAVPAGFLRLTSKLVGMSRAYDQLCGTLQVDDALIRNQLGFVPQPYPFEL